MTDPRHYNRRGRVMIEEQFLRELLGIPDSVILTGVSASPLNPATLVLDIMSEDLRPMNEYEEVPILRSDWFMVSRTFDGNDTYYRVRWEGPWGPEEPVDPRPWLRVTSSPNPTEEEFAEIDQAHQDAVEEGFLDAIVIWGADGMSVRKGMRFDG